ncbi:MAG TPA: hypothetical protein VEB65_12800 [Solirubrobacterales bacterium]|nr:hypothetical protein [Solirubrobacterales bacterium]
MTSELDFSADERLFGSGTDDYRNTAMTIGTTSDAVPYAASFWEAGDILVKRGVETRTQDLVAFPSLYCYRHALELATKNVVYEWERTTTGAFELLGTHDLGPLWNRTRAALEGAWPNGDTSQLDRMEAIIGELAAIDSKGELFRYDLDKEGFVRDIPEELKRFDLVTVSQVITKLLALLFGALDGIAYLRENGE